MTVFTKQRIMLVLSLLLSLLFCIYGAIASWLCIGDYVNVFDHYGDVRIAGVTVRVLSVITAACVFSLSVAELIKNNDTGFRFVAHGIGVGAGLVFSCYFDLIGLELNKIAWLFVAVPVVLVLGFETARYFVFCGANSEKHNNTSKTYFAAGACILALIVLIALLVNMFVQSDKESAFPVRPLFFSVLYTSVAAVWIVYVIVTRKNILSALRFVVGFMLFAAQILGFAYKTERCFAAYGFIGTDILLVGFCTPLFCACLALAVVSIEKLFEKNTVDRLSY